MTRIAHLIATINRRLAASLTPLDGLPALALRLYLVPVMWMAGSSKLMHFQDTVNWFGNDDWGLGLPFPTLMAALATAAELGGALFLLVGLATRWIAVPLAAHPSGPSLYLSIMARLNGVMSTFSTSETLCASHSPRHR